MATKTKKQSGIHLTAEEAGQIMSALIECRARVEYLTETRIEEAHEAEKLLKERSQNLPDGEFSEWLEAWGKVFA